MVSVQPVPTVFCMTCGCDTGQLGESAIKAQSAWLLVWGGGGSARVGDSGTSVPPLTIEASLTPLRPLPSRRRGLTSSGGGGGRRGKLRDHRFDLHESARRTKDRRVVVSDARTMGARRTGLGPVRRPTRNTRRHTVCHGARHMVRPQPWHRSCDAEPMPGNHRGIYRAGGGGGGLCAAIMSPRDFATLGIPKAPTAARTRERASLCSVQIQKEASLHNI